MTREAAHTVDSKVVDRTTFSALGLGLGVLGFAALTALGARLSVPLPGTAVPMTLQPVAVLLAGVVLGSRAGAASQVAYLAAGALGLPLFAAGGGAAYLLGPTGGYLLAFPVAAAVAGLATDRARGWIGAALTLALALAVIHLGGLAWLWILGGRAFVETTGVRVFLLGDLLKVMLVLAIARWGRNALRRMNP
jgi:biotin transport system substrate-specific component